MAGESLALRSVSDSAATASPRRSDVQGLRGVAVACVVAFHAGLPLPGGFVGVDVFFVISGFVITTMLAREWASANRIDFRHFYLRRFQRLTPALAVMVAGTLLGSAVVLSPVGPQQVTAATGFGAVLLAANLVIASTTGGYFDPTAELNPLLHTWSLSVEEQFYLVFPMIVVAGWAAARRHRMARLAPAVLVTVVGLGSFTATLAPSLDIVPSGLATTALGFYSPLTRAWEFAAGAGLALHTLRFPRVSARAGSLSGAVGAILLVSSLCLITETTTFPGFATLLPVAGTLLLLHAGCSRENPARRFLSTPALVKTGDWSYSIYLWHWPLIVFAGLLWPERPLVPLAAAAVSIVPALASYRWVEQPIRNMNLVLRRGAGTLVATTLLVPLLLAGMVAVAAANGYWSREVQALQESKAPHSATQCDRKGGNFCHWNVGAAGSPVYLVGDSHAGHFGDAAINAAIVAGRPASLSMAYNCPFAIGLEIALVHGSASCLAHNSAVMEVLTHAAPGTVLIAGADTYWAEGTWAVGLARATPTTKAEKKLRDWEAALALTVDQLQRTGHTVVLVHTVPLHMGYDPARCATSRIRDHGCSHVVAESEARQLQGAARNVIERVADQTHSSTLDTWAFFCAEGACNTNHGNSALYTNWSHISVAASRALEGLFAEAMEEKKT